MRALEGGARRLAGRFQAQGVANTLWAYAKMGREPGEELMRALEGRAEATAESFGAQGVANTLWAYATMGREPGEGLMRALEGRAEAVTRAFSMQNLANVLWAYAKMGRRPGEGLMRELEGCAEALAGSFNAQDVANTLWAYATMGREPKEGLMRALEGRTETVAKSMKTQELANTMWAYATLYRGDVPGREGRELGTGVVKALEGRAEATAGIFNAQCVANTLWAYATMGREPGEGLMRALEGRAEALAGSFNAQDVANTMWAYATIGREPGEGLMRALEMRTEEVAASFNAQNVANTLWSACVFATLFASKIASRWAQLLAQLLVSRAACYSEVNLCQLHQVFLSCSLEEKLHVEAFNDMHSDMQALRDACRSAFEGTRVTPSATQQQVSKTLRSMGLRVEDEFRCPKSGYSFDMLVSMPHDIAPAMGGEGTSTSRDGTWVVEFDGPSHFLACSEGGGREGGRARTGATCLKQRHLQLLGYSFFSVPHWEWDACEGFNTLQATRERQQYLGRMIAMMKPQLRDATNLIKPAQTRQVSTVSTAFDGVGFAPA